MKRLTFFIMALCFVVSSVYAQGLDLRPLEMDGTEWTITATSEGEGRAETFNDTLSFQDKKFISSVYDKKKYSPTNYTTYLKDDGSTIFETMQTKDDDMVLWHGSVLNQEVRGIVSVHLANGSVKDYSFSGTLAGGTLVLQEPAAPPVQVEEPAPQPAE